MNQFINELIYGFIHLWPAYITFVFVTDHIPILECCLISKCGGTHSLVVLLLCIESVFQLEFAVNSVVLPSFCCVPIKIQISIIYEHVTPHM